MAFSGGGLVDWQNSAGFQSGAEAPLVVAFTSTGRGECLAFSNDHGRTLTEWEGNPFLAHRGRDPKILWLEKTREWALIVYEELAGEENPGPQERGYAFYTSPDLKCWTRHSFLPGYYECPELFRLPLDGETAWVVYGAKWQGAHSTCLIGDFDGGIFTAREENITAHAGPQFYAAQTFSDTPDGRVILMGWMAGADFPGMPFSQAMTVPLELSLRRTPDGTRLCFNPVRELEALRADSASAGPLDFAGANHFLAEHDSQLLDLQLALEPGGPLALDIRGHRLTYDPAARALTFAGSSAVLPGFSGPLTLRVLVDRSVTEIFANAGLAAFSAMTIFADPGQPVRLEGQGSAANISVQPLRGIW
jgi:fructan beta-fructosidase